MKGLTRPCLEGSAWGSGSAARREVADSFITESELALLSPHRMVRDVIAARANTMTAAKKMPTTPFSVILRSPAGGCFLAAWLL